MSADEPFLTAAWNQTQSDVSKVVYVLWEKSDLSMTISVLIFIFLFFNSSELSCISVCRISRNWFTMLLIFYIIYMYKTYIILLSFHCL